MIVTRLVAFAALVASLAVPLDEGDAHRARSGWIYPPACCKGMDVGGDCQAIPTNDVTMGRRGYDVIIHPGDHYLATRMHRFFVLYGDEIPSGDENFHICLHPTEDDLNCFFAPKDDV